MVSLETAILFNHALADFNLAVSQYRKIVPRQTALSTSIFVKMILSFHFQSKGLEIETGKLPKFQLKLCIYLIESISNFVVNDMETVLMEKPVILIQESLDFQASRLFVCQRQFWQVLPTNFYFWQLCTA